MKRFWPIWRFRLFTGRRIWWRGPRRPFRRSLVSAGRGIIYVFLSERSMRWQALAAISALILAWFFQVKVWEWLILIMVVFLVMVAEVANTALEITVDLVTKKLRPRAQAAKDVAAGGVLLASIGALIIGMIIFLPRLITVFSGW